MYNTLPCYGCGCYISCSAFEHNICQGCKNRSGFWGKDPRLEGVERELEAARKEADGESKCADWAWCGALSYAYRICEEEDDLTVARLRIKDATNDRIPFEQIVNESRDAALDDAFDAIFSLASRGHLDSASALLAMNAIRALKTT